MKKSFLFFGMFFTCVFALSACQTAQIPYSPGSGVQHQNVCIPEWVKNPKNTADAVYGIGRAKLRNQSLTKQAADGSARTQIIKIIRIKIDAYFKDFIQEAGIGEDAESLIIFSEAVARQISREALHGCKIIDHKFCPDGEVWSLAMLTLNQVEKIKSTTKQKLNEYGMKKVNEFGINKGPLNLQKELDSMNFNE